MNERRKKLVAAAVTAVLQYRAEQCASVPVPVMPVPTVCLPSVWSLSGRQELMSLRGLWQRRIAR